MSGAREVVFRPSPKQFRAWEYLTDQETTELGYGGGGSGGKSYLGCFFLLSMCEAYPDTGWLMGRKELKNLEKTTLLTFFKACQEHGFEIGRHFTYNQQKNIINWHNKSQVFLTDLSYQPQDPLYTRLGGLELTGGFIDESNECPAEGKNIVRTRLGRRQNDRYGLKPKLLETFNPDKGEVYTRYYKPWREQELPAYRKFIQALPQDNPHTSRDYIEQLEQADEVTKQRLLYGNFEYDDDPATLMDYDSITDLFTNTVDPGDGYLVCDVARFGADTTVLTRWKGLECVEVVQKAKLATDDTARLIREYSVSHAIPYSRILVDEDGVGGGVKDQLRGIKGFVANSVPLDLREPGVGLKRNYANLKAQCGYKLAELVNDHRIAVRGLTPKQHDELIQELEQIKAWQMDKDGKLKLMPKEEVKKNIGRSPDLSDCLLMRCYFEIFPRRQSDPLKSVNDKDVVTHFRVKQARDGLASRL